MSMAQLSFSVALCTYNGSRFLSEQLRSICSQSRPPDELVICDDRSSDNTVEIVKKFAVDAPFPVRLQVNPDNLGSTKNFELAISRCSGDVIALSDQDDVWVKDKLAQMERVLLHSPSVGAVFSDADVVDEQLNPLGYKLWERYGFNEKRRRHLAEGRTFQVLLEQNAVTGATLAFRSWLKEWVIPIPACWMHDAWIAAVTAAVCDLSTIEEPLIRYRQHTHNQVGGRKPRMPDFLRAVFRENSSFYHDYVNQLKLLRQRLTRCPRLRRLDDLSRLDSKILHFETRARMPERRLKRLRFVMQELFTLRYFRFSKGGISLAKDLFLSRN
jgi:glycosyltransferase involved in cell wall biosynthesis